MASQAQVLANTQNAQLSTGPKSEAGKTASKLNAFRHGLTAKTVVFSPEEEEAFATFSAAMLLEIPAFSATERQIAQEMVITQWRINRVPVLEANLIMLGRLEPAPQHLADLEDSPVKTALLESNALIVHERELRNLHLQEQRLQRHLIRLTGQIAALQTAREVEAEQIKAAEAAEQIEAAPPAEALPYEMPYDMPDDLLDPIGFDFTSLQSTDPHQPLSRFDARLQMMQDASVRHAELRKQHRRNHPASNVHSAL